MNQNISKMIWSVWGALAKYAGHAYIAGPELEDALRTCRHLSGLGIAGTLCFWNIHGDPPERVADAYASALVALANENLDCYLSAKLPPLHFDRDLLKKLLELGRSRNTLIHFDSLGPETADQTFEILAEAAHEYPHLGCTLPGRWLRSTSDAATAIDLRLHVRVVKGQWEDQEHPGIVPDEGFLNVIGRLAGQARSVAVATHDPELARTALKQLINARTPCTLELLYGLPVKPALSVARALGVPMRVYVPYGHGWLPYSLSQARRNPRILWWMLRDLFSEGASFVSNNASSGVLTQENRAGSLSSVFRA